MMTRVATALLICACGGNGTTVGGGETDDPATTTDNPDDPTSPGETSDTDEPPTDPDPDPDPNYEYLTPVEHLNRISMALRGMRPSPADIERVRSNPDAIEELVDTYMEGTAFAEVVRNLHNDALLVQIGYPLPGTGPLDGVFVGEISKAVGETPLRLVERVVTEDRPYSEIVTADYWMVNEHTSVAYGLPFESDGPRWQPVPIPGSRPAAGVLSDNTFFLRHESAGANYHRGRANAVTRALLCQDFLALEVDVEGGVDLSDPAEVANAVQTNPSCIACHDQLDGISSHFFGYPGEVNAQLLEEAGYPLPDLWQPQLVDNWQTTNERAPEYFGEASNGLGDLGTFIADDPRFALCAVKRFYSYFHQMPLDDVPGDEVDVLEAAFLDDGLNARTLMREIVLADSFRRAAAIDEALADEVRGYKKTRPFQLALLVEDLTGFDWEIRVELEDPMLGVGGISVLRDPRIGLAVLAGGIDSQFITQPALTVNATTVLALQQLASEAASFAVEHDFQGADPRLLTSVGKNETDETAIRDQLVRLADRIYAEERAADDEDIDLLWDVFSGALDAGGGDVTHAWKATLTAMLSDLSIIYY